MTRPSRRNGFRFICLVTLAAGFLFSSAPAFAHGGSSPVAWNPFTGSPIMNMRELQSQRNEFFRNRYHHLTAAPVVATATPAASILLAPAAGGPQTTTWNGNVSYTPDALIYPPYDGGDPCPWMDFPDECEEFRLTVSGESRTLYLKISWAREDYSLSLYAIDPSGDQYGLDYSEISSEYDKFFGNSTTLPLSEVTVENPEAGEWTIRVRSAWGLNVDYQGIATVTSEPPIPYPKQNNIDLAKWATHKVPVNIVFAGWKPTDKEIQQARENLPPQYRTTVLYKQGPDGGPTDSEADEEDNCSGGNWSRCHYGGTYSDDKQDAGGFVPYFEPVKFEYDYHFIAADDDYTKAAFAKMKELTKSDAKTQGGYLRSYAATGGQFRDPKVSPDKRMDIIDARALEDWIYNSRFEFCDNFTDLESDEVMGGGFISPDNEGYFDPYYDRNGRNVNRMPQGRNEGYTIFFFDTYSPEYAGEYFDQSKYHNFFVEFIDPDTDENQGINYARLWGGNYRFAFFDMGSAPNSAEANTPLIGGAGGSADYPGGDPPIWEYRNNPIWRERLIPQGIARNVLTLLFSRMTAGYLYRPIPHEIYQLTTTNFLDYYSRADSGWGIRTGEELDLTTVYDEDLAARWLSSAIPHTTFKGAKELKDFSAYRYPGCARYHVKSKNATLGLKNVDIVPDPSCIGKEPDPLQEKIEEAKGQGDDIFGMGIPFEQAVSASVIRNYWEANRDTYAPIGDGVYSMILINATWEKAYTWSLPLIVGGISFPTPDGENWGNFQNNNDWFRGGFTYVVEHEASHGLGLLHPHDSLGVERDEEGNWDYYYDTYVWLPDMTQSPTTYLGNFYPYGIWDQDNLMRGHVAEYIQMAQDSIADAYFEAGRQGITAIDQAPDVVQREQKMNSYLERGRDLFSKGDYLQAEYAFRNALYAAEGRTGSEVAPREVRPTEKLFFETDLQPGPTRNRALRVCGVSLHRPLAATGTATTAALAALGSLLLATGALLANWLRRSPFHGL